MQARATDPSMLLSLWVTPQKVFDSILHPLVEESAAEQASTQYTHSGEMCEMAEDDGSHASGARLSN